MEDQENIDDVRIDMQAVGVDVDDDFKDRVTGALGRLRRYYSGDVITAEVYMRQESQQRSDTKTLRIKYGVPGDDVVADDTGESWDHLLNTVTAKLKHQLDRRFSNSQNSYRNR